MRWPASGRAFFRVLLAVGHRAGESLSVGCHPVVDAVLDLPDNWHLIQPKQCRHAQRPRQRRIHRAGPPMEPAIGFHSPRRLFALLDGEAGCFGRTRLLEGNGRHATVAVKGVEPLDAPRAEASGSVEEQNQAMTGHQ